MLNVAMQLLALSNKANNSTRRCSICEEHKPLSNFTVKDKRNGYLDTRCKPCKSKAITSTKVPKVKIVDPLVKEFMDAFKGIPTNKVISIMNNATKHHINWSGCNKKLIASRWAVKDQPNSGYTCLKKLNLTELRTSQY